MKIIILITKMLYV